MIHQQLQQSTQVNYFTRKSDLKFTSVFATQNTHVNIQSNTLTRLLIENQHITRLNVSKCTRLEILECTNNKIEELIVNDRLLSLSCSNNRLVELSLNEDLAELFCDYNNITRLKLNKNLKTLHCNNNELTRLDLNRSLEILICDRNHLSSIKTNRKLKYLSCADNLLTELALNRNISMVDCMNNKFASMVVNEKIYSEITKHDYPPFIFLPEAVPAFKRPNKIPNDFVCAICLQNNKDDVVVVADCNHVCHMRCMTSAGSVDCPDCGRPIRPFKVTTSHVRF